MKRLLVFSCFLAISLSACSGCDDDVALSGVGEACETEADCLEGLDCITGLCISPGADTDGDGVDDEDDNCPSVSNPDQLDSDDNGVGDACEPGIANDSDDDQVADDDDNCPNVSNPGQTDTDGDGQGDACDDDDDDDTVNDDMDNCPLTPNTDQADVDMDGTGDVCDDDDGDGVTDDTDNCPNVSNPNQADFDMDGVGDACDPDIDGDGVDNDDDNCPNVPNTDQADEDEDDIGDVCDPDTTRRSGLPTNANCTYSAPTGVFDPVVEWSISIGMNDPYPDRDQVMMTPAVANLTDDNADGVIDEMDIPDVIYTSFATNGNPAGWDELGYGVLRAAKGDGTGLLWSVGYTELGLADTGGVQPAGSIAVGDIDNDGNVEIITGLWDNATETGGLVAVNHDGTVLWTTSYEVNGVAQPRQFKYWWGGPSIGDIDGDGNPEIVIGAVVFDNTGALKWDGADATLNGAQGEGINWPGGNSTRTTYTGPLSLLADLDGVPDPVSNAMTLEVVTGRTAYRSDGTVLWEDLTGLPDGFPAVADFNDDQLPEVVVSSNGTVRVHDGATGAVVWGPVVIEGLTPGAALIGEACVDDLDCATNRCSSGGTCQTAGRIGPPTIADFDGAAGGRPEVGVAVANQYVTLKIDLANPTATYAEAKLWARETQDSSSNMTGSSVFDFEGDGVAEVVYNDELYLRVFDGATGTVLFEEPNNSFTALENPIIVDVDNDGAAEIVVGTNDFECGDRLSCTPGFSGLRVFGDDQDNWVATRRIWNQHTYHINNVEENGAIPTQEAASWTDHNTYRLNAQTTIDPEAAPDLIVQDHTAVLDGCLAVIQGWVVNQGAERVGAGLPVSFYADEGNGRVYLGMAQTQLPLEPGQAERVELRVTLMPGGPYTFIIVADDDAGMGGIGTKRECDEGNNEADAATNQMCVQ